MTNEEQIYNMVVARNADYDTATRSIFDKMVPVLQGINKYFENVSRNISYGDIYFEEENNVIIIHTEPVYNTKTKQHHQLTIGLPADLLDETESDVIYQFLINAELQKAQQAQLSGNTKSSSSKPRLH